MSDPLDYVTVETPYQEVPQTIDPATGLEEVVVETTKTNWWLIAAVLGGAYLLASGKYKALI